MNLKGKVAYITGGTKGIGHGVAECLLAQGMKVAISGRSEAGVQVALKSLGDTENVLGIRSDVSSLSDETVAVKKILDKWGQLDLVLAEK